MFRSSAYNLSYGERLITTNRQILHDHFLCTVIGMLKNEWQETPQSPRRVHTKSFGFWENAPPLGQVVGLYKPRAKSSAVTKVTPISSGNEGYCPENFGWTRFPPLQSPWALLALLRILWLLDERWLHVWKTNHTRLVSFPVWIWRREWFWFQRKTNLSAGGMGSSWFRIMEGERPVSLPTVKQDSWVLSPEC